MCQENPSRVEHHGEVVRVRPRVELPVPFQPWQPDRKPLVHLVNQPPAAPSHPPFSGHPGQAQGLPTGAGGVLLPESHFPSPSPLLLSPCVPRPLLLPLVSVSECPRTPRNSA